VSGHWGKLFVVCAVVTVWRIYDMAGATEARSQAEAILDYTGLALGLVGLVGSGMMYMSAKSGRGV